MIIDTAAFKHVVVPLGVIIGLGVVHIITALSKYLENRSNVRFDIAHSIWTAITLLWFVGLWWLLWKFRVVEVGHWSFFSLLLLLLGPSILYFAASLLLPSTQPGESLDLGDRFDQVGRLFFLCLCGTGIWLGIAEIVLLRQSITEPHRFGQLAVVILLAICAAFPSRRIAKYTGLLILFLAIIAFSTFRAGLG